MIKRLTNGRNLKQIGKELISPKVFKGYFKFGYANAIISLFQLGLTILITEGFKVWFYYPYSISLAVGTIILYFYHRHITFESRGQLHIEGTKFLISSATMLALNLLLVLIFERVFRIIYIVSVIIVAILVSIISYNLNKKLVFTSNSYRY